MRSVYLVLLVAKVCVYTFSSQEVEYQIITEVRAN